MTLDLEAVGVALAQVAPVLLFLGRESERWRAELARWREELSGARITIEPATTAARAAVPGPAPEATAPAVVALPPDDDTDEDGLLRRHARDTMPPGWADPRPARRTRGGAWAR